MERENSGKHSSERGGRRLKAAPEEGPFGSPGSGPRERDGLPPLQGLECAPVRGANAGGTAEGFAFRPSFGAEGFFVGGVKGVCRLECSYRVLSQELEELLVWLKDTQYAKTVREIIDILNDENLREKKKDWLRQMLSIECGIFHIKWLGDCYVADFPSDGSSYPWLNYLARLAKLSQKVLK